MSDIYLSLTETPSVVTLSQPVVSGVLSSNVTVTNVVSVNVVTMPAINVTAAAPSVTTVAGTVAVSNFPAVTTVAGTVALDANSLSALENVTVTIGAAVSISNFPSTQTIAGTVTVGNSVTVGAIVGPSGGSCLKSLSPSGDAVRSLLFTKDSGGTYGELSGSGVGIFNLPVYGTVTVGNSVTIGSLPAISGTVTANVPLSPDAWAGNDGIRVVGNGSDGALRIGGYDPSSGAQLSIEEGGGIPVFAAGQVALPISGTVTANLAPQAKGPILEIDSAIPNDPKYVAIVGGFDTDAVETRALKLGSSGQVIVSPVTIGSLPSGALTTRFGSVTTANTAQITSAVTNTSRKYLLAQNISGGTVTIGIGFSPTTTQGIQLTAGGGLTFDAFCPTGAVYWLGAVTGAAFTILEG